MKSLKISRNVTKYNYDDGTMLECSLKVILVLENYLTDVYVWILSLRDDDSHAEFREVRSNYIFNVGTFIYLCICRVSWLNQNRVRTPCV